MSWPPTGTWPGELARAALVGGLFLSLFAVAEGWRWWRKPPVEWTRKLVHFGGGAVAALFPWLFEWPVTVLLIGVVSAVFLTVTRALGWLQSVHGVTRKSEGALLFPVAVYLLFVLSHRQPVFYLISILTLVVADALAAVLGASYGRRTYRVEGQDRRSVEGSAVFLLTAFLAVHLPLLLLTTLGRPESVLISIQVALLLACLEAISLRGADNLFVPLGCLYLLEKMTPKPAVVIGWQLVAQLGCIALVGLIAWRSRLLTFSGGIATALGLYGAFALGGAEWTVAPLLLLVGLMILVWPRGLPVTPRQPTEPPRTDGRYQVVAVFYTSLVPVALYMANNALETMPTGWLPRLPTLLRSVDPMYPLYLGAIAAHLAILLVGHLQAGARAARPGIGVLTRAVAFGAMAVVPVGLIVAAVGASVGSGLVALAVPLVAVPLDQLLRHGSSGGRHWPRGSLWELRRHAASVALSVLLVLPEQLVRLGAL